MSQAFPLQWPHGRPRTAMRRDSVFRVHPTQAFEQMIEELGRFTVKGVVVSTNIPLRQDGTPYRDGLTDLLKDPGVALYFTRKGRQVCLSCDTYRRPWENVRAIGLAVESFRAIERHGAHQILDQAFEGFTALPAPGDVSAAPDRAWWVILGVPATASAEEIKNAYRDRAREAGGASVELNLAKEAGLLSRGAALASQGGQHE